MMTPERWSQIKDIFTSVMDRSAEERQSALVKACQGDAELQAELRQLLAQHDEMGKFLDGDTPPSATSMLNPGYLLAKRYEIVALLGSGGMGEVYEAQDQELGGRIALKVIHPQMSFDPATLDRFRREVQLARQVTHPNVCRVFDIGHHQQQGREIIFLTMELVRGETLSARLKRAGKIESQEALIITVQLCQALGAAHQAGILHRDFKCGNVMLIGSGEKVRAVVTDFGIARWMRSTEDSAGALTTRGAIFGTPAYMSPEQIQGKELTVASDIYALGLVLYEMVTGRRPFQDESPWTEALKRLTENPAEPGKGTADSSRIWNRVILQCLERDPKNRFASTAEVIASLRGKGKPSSIVLGHPRSAILVVLLILAVVISVAFRAHIFARSLPAEKHIAVLPFKFAGNDPANQATAYGLAESLSGNLSRLQNLGSSTWVVPWQAVKERPANDDSHAGSSLGANLLITGELERRSGHLRLTAELKDASTLAALRSELIDIPEAEVMTLEDRLLERAATMLQFNLPSGTLQRLRVSETPVPGAYEFYEQGKGYLLRLTPEDMDHAIDLLHRAIEKDPGFALAQANLAFAYEWKYRATKEAKWLDQARQVCAQAMSLNDKLSPIHLTLGLIREDLGDLDGSIKELVQAWQLDPANDEARNLLSLAYDQAGRLLEAQTLLKDAIQRNPASWINYNDLGVFYYHHQQYSQAEPLFRAATELAPGNPKAFYNLGGMYAVQGKFKEAETVLLRAIAIKPAAGAYSNLGTVLRSQGRYEESAGMLQKAVELGPGDYRLWSNLGNAYALAGNQAKAMQAYDKAVQTIEKTLALQPRNGQLLQSLALNYAKLQQKDKALLTLARITGPLAHDPGTLFDSALVYELIGERQRALAELHASVLAGLPLERIQNTPTFNELRADKRYSRMVDAHAGDKPVP
jgi:serine/threonine protein kinase/tetratricopeptide (TPR) repeat protein